MCVGTKDSIRVWQRSTLSRDTSWTAVCTRRHFPVNAIAFSPDGFSVAVGGTDGIMIWETERMLDEIPDPEPPVRLVRNRGGACIALAWSRT